jgi:hypothetical protein
MKQLIIVCVLVISNALYAQIAVFQPVKVPAGQAAQFEEIELNYSKKIAQNAVNDGKLQFWVLFKAFNPGPDDYNYMWISVYQDLKAATAGTPWWNNAEDLVGIPSNILYSGHSTLTWDRSYYYEMALEIPEIAPPTYVLFNFASPDNVGTLMEQVKTTVIPHFKKKMPSAGLVGWGMGLKITPKGDDYASMMVYDSYNSLEAAMEHLAGRAALEGLPAGKVDPIKWSMRPLMQVLSRTEPKQ